MFGPMSVASSRGSPWRSAAARAVNRAVNSPAIASSTSSLVPARHTCPALSNLPTACPTARSRSASANTSNGDFPPSSSETGVSCPPAAAATCRPVAPEPVKATRATPGCATSGAPASAPRPWTTLNTPSGRPASRVMSASRLAVSGAHSGGLATTVFPAASAGAMRQVASINGAFHGVITAVTPDGSQETRSACPETSRSPGSRRPSQSAKNSKLCATLGITLRRCERSSEPLSRVSTWASSSVRARTPAAMARSTAARLDGGVAAQPPNASRAAPTAASTSAAPPRATSAMGASSIGDTSLNVAGEATLRPPIQWRVSTATPATRAGFVGNQITPEGSFGAKLSYMDTIVATLRHRAHHVRRSEAGSGLVWLHLSPEAVRELGPGADAQLRVRVRQVALDGVDGHEQGPGDLLAGAAGKITITLSVKASSPVTVSYLVIRT